MNTHDPADTARLQQSAKDHLWMHFTRHSPFAENVGALIVRGEGAYLYDAHGKR